METYYRSLYRHAACPASSSAAYVGVSPSLFNSMVKDRRMPPPKRINDRTVWDRKRLDAAFDALPDDGDGSNPWDEVAA